MNGHEERHEQQEERGERAEERIAHWLEDIARSLKSLASIYQVRDFELFQIDKGEILMAINGTAAGSTSTFQIGMVPATGFVPLTSGPTVTVDDPGVVLTQPDKTGTFTAAVPAGDTGTSYNLTVSGVNGAGTALTHVFNIPILTPVPVQVTDFSLNQIS